MMLTFLLQVVTLLSGQTDETVVRSKVTVEASPQAVQPVGDLAAAPSIDRDRVLLHLLDPEQVPSYTEEQIRDGDKPDPEYYKRLLQRISAVRRPAQVRLTLDDVVERTLQHSFGLQVARYSPAIEATRVVEAQAAFDASLFSNITKQIQDRPSGSQLSATKSDQFSNDSGIRKILN